MGRVRGVLHTPAGAEHGRLTPSSKGVAEYVEHYWWARWRLDSAQSTEVLSYPSVHVVFEGDKASIVGVVRARFVRQLVGHGEVFGIKFRPGMFRPLCEVSVHALTDQTIPLAAKLGKARLSDEIRCTDSTAQRAAVAERALQRALPAKPPAQALLARDLVDRIRTESSLRGVAALASASGMTERALQRLFREFVGVSPKWVVRRFRLQEAAHLLAASTETVASVAASLGYFDQAHFTRDFKAVVGRTPIEFLTRSRSP
ncbi:MAG: helix-turn-helix domain-containing protein [Polyangiaceae bacterium]